MKRVDTTMRILVTGHSGFIGSNLVPYLESLGHTVVGCSRRTGVDLLGKARAESLTRDCKLLFHLAAEAKPAESLLSPSETFSKNTRMTIKVALACRDSGIPMVYASSCEIYGDSGSPIKEDSEIKPTNPYAASKAACDRLLYAFYKCYNMDVKTVRLFNPYGPHQQLNKIMPTFYRQAEANKDITVYGDGSDTRDYVFTDDIVKGLWEARRLEAGQVVNLATGVATTNLEVAEMIIGKTRSKSKIKFTPYPKIFGGIKRQVGSYEKARMLLNWEPKVKLEEGIDRTINWLESLDDKIQEQ